MALLKCRECGGQVSSFAESCPHCGYSKERAEYLRRIAEEREKSRQREIELEKLEASGELDRRRKAADEQRRALYTDILMDSFHCNPGHIS